jgi:hypothetical protein
MRISVNGDGFVGVYTARNTDKGWAFIKNDGTFLTTGWGAAHCSGKAAYCGVASPITRATPEQMIADVRAARPKIQITEMKDED